jgi:hypothetical protein
VPSRTRRTVPALRDLRPWVLVPATRRASHPAATNFGRTLVGTIFGRIVGAALSFPHGQLVRRSMLRGIARGTEVPHRLRLYGVSLQAPILARRHAWLRLRRLLFAPLAAIRPRARAGLGSATLARIGTTSMYGQTLRKLGEPALDSRASALRCGRVRVENTAKLAFRGAGTLRHSRCNAVVETALVAVTPGSSLDLPRSVRTERTQMKKTTEKKVSLKRLRFSKETLKTLTVTTGLKTGREPECSAFTDCRISGVTTRP